MSELKKTPLYQKHIDLGARMIEFGNWVMPVDYSGILNEHKATRNDAGLFDLTHMGQLKIEGDKRLDLVQRLITNDASVLSENQILYTAVCRADGGILDDILVYRLKDSFFLVVNASNIEKIYSWFKKNELPRTVVTDVSDDNALIAIQGPKSLEVFQTFLDFDLSKMIYYHCDFIKVMNYDCLVSRTGYTGEDGFEIYCKPAYAEHIWNKVMEAGLPFGILPVGLGARDTLRLEAAYCLYGHEISENINPLEAGLKWVVKFNKGDFIGKDALERFEKRRQLVGFEMAGRGIPRQGYKIVNDRGEVGFVTSGTFSPTLNKSIGLGYVPVEYMEIGAEIEIIIREKSIKAKIVKTPFYRGSVKTSKLIAGN